MGGQLSSHMSTISIECVSGATENRPNASLSLLLGRKVIVSVIVQFESLGREMEMIVISGSYRSTRMEHRLRSRTGRESRKKMSLQGRGAPPFPPKLDLPYKNTSRAPD